MECPECRKEMERIPLFRGARDEPAHDAYYECERCGCVEPADDYDAACKADTKYDDWNENGRN